MQLKKLLSDDEGVSPVIGVILMVAITVILAAVIAAFVLGLGDSDDVAPQTTFEFDLDEGEESGSLTITATSGDTIDQDQVFVEVEGDEDLDGDNAGDGFDVSDDIAEFDEDISAGTSGTLTNLYDSDGADLTDGGTVNVIWESDDGDDSSILASFDVPEE